MRVVQRRRRRHRARSAASSRASGSVALEVTTEGDGRVTHESGRLPDVATWYMDAAHGELAGDERGFPAILDLLAARRPRAARHTSRRARAAAASASAATLPEPVLYPTGGRSLVGVFGQRPASGLPRDATAAGFRVSVVHGDLTFARSRSSSATTKATRSSAPESVVDRLFDGALTTRYNLGLYPGPLGTCRSCSVSRRALQRALQLPNGAIVVGLGRWGELTAGQIANLVRRGALQYVLQLDDASSPRKPRRRRHRFERQSA